MWFTVGHFHSLSLSVAYWGFCGSLGLIVAHCMIFYIQRSKYLALLKIYQGFRKVYTFTSFLFFYFFCYGYYFYLIFLTGNWNVSRVIPRLYGWIYNTLRFFPLVVEHSIVVMSARLNPMGSRFSIPKSGRKILRPSWGLRHLWFEFNYHYDGILTCFSILIFWTLCVEKRWGGDRKHYFVNFCCLVVLEFSLDEGCGLGQKLLFRASWNRIFFQPGFQPKK